jgi:glucose/mannose-6-phosphate isomerase
MIEDFTRFKKDFSEASKLGMDIKLPKFDKIVFCGIGGSGFTGDVIENLDLGVPVIPVRQKLPRIVDERTLCFIVSYSGNTKETWNLYKHAKAKKCKIIIITSGGKLGKQKDKKIIVPSGYLPREAFLWLLLPVLNILNIHYNKKLTINMNKIKKMASDLKNRSPLVYAGSEHLGFLAYRWETFFQENAKVIAQSGYFPELNHNEIESRFDSRAFEGILLYEKKEKGIANFKKLVNIDFMDVQLKGKTFVDKIIYGTYFGFLLSFYLAKELEVDYRSIERIKKLKRMSR